MQIILLKEFDLNLKYQIFEFKEKQSKNSKQKTLTDKQVKVNKDYFQETECKIFQKIKQNLKKLE